MTDEIKVAVKLGKRFSITIPKQIRTNFPLYEGDWIEIVRKKFHIELHLMDADPHKKIARLLRGIDYHSKKTVEKAEEYLFSET